MDTFDGALNILRNHQTSRFESCMEAMRVLSDLRGDAAQKAEKTLIDVARDSAYVWLRQAALNRLKDMVTAEMKLPQKEQKLVTFDLASSMVLILNDDAPDHYKDQAGKLSKRLLTEMSYTQNLAHNIISATLQSTPSDVVKSYLKVELEKHSHKFRRKQETIKKEKADTIRTLKAEIYDRRNISRTPEPEINISQPAPVKPPSTPVATQAASAAPPPPRSGSPVPKSPEEREKSLPPSLRHIAHLRTPKSELLPKI